MTRHRSAVTGEFVSAKDAAANPRETVSEEDGAPVDNAAELARLEAMLAASRGMEGHKERREAIEAKLEELRGE